MTAAPIHPGEKRWSRRRWLALITFLFFAHIAFVLIVSRQQPGTPHKIKPKTDFHLMVAPTAERAFDMLLAGDPTVFVLPNEHGFSGTAWMKTPKTVYQPPDWDEAPRWLRLDAQKLGQKFVEQIRLNRATLIQIADKLPVPRESPSILAPVSDPRPPLQMEGDIASRARFAIPEFPVWTNSEPIADTILQIAINGSGDVVSARIGSLGFSPATQSASSLAAADETALAFARTLRFEPVNSNGNAMDLTWGNLIFHWQTVPPPANAANGSSTENR